MPRRRCAKALFESTHESFEALTSSVNNHVSDGTIERIALLIQLRELTVRVRYLEQGSMSVMLRTMP